MRYRGKQAKHADANPATQAANVEYVETMPGVYVEHGEFERLVARRRAYLNGPKQVRPFPLDADPYIGPLLRRAG
jgi:hypothetical protein